MAGMRSIYWACLVFPWVASPSKSSQTIIATSEEPTSAACAQLDEADRRKRLGSRMKERRRGCPADVAAVGNRRTLTPAASRARQPG